VTARGPGPTLKPLLRRARARMRRLSPLQAALAVSVGLHLLLLTVRLVDPEGFNRVFRDTPLEVILVNAKSNEAPGEAQAIAQVTLAGGGEAARGRATSPLPPSREFKLGDAPDNTRRRV
jgi:periplasmic protein TonB